MNNNLLNAKELVPILLQYKQNNPDKKIAFCFSGGGARGAYFGGVIEGIKQEIDKLQTNLSPEDRWIPDIICGTSAGAIAGFSYWMECLSPKSSSTFACRQSDIWYDISNGNKGGEKLFDNPVIIEYLSKSSETLDNLLDSVDKFNDDIKPIIENLDSQWTNIKLIISNVASFDTSKLGNNIQNRIENIRSKVNSAGSPPSGKDALKLGNWENYADNLKNLVRDIHTIVPELLEDFTKMQIEQAKNLLENIKDLKSDIDDSRKNDIFNTLKDLKILSFKLQDLYKELKTVFFLTKFYIKECSSLMNTNGLQNILENFIFNSFPSNSLALDKGKLDARKLDEAIIKLVDEKKMKNKKVPDLFLTGTNINAKRGVAFSLAEDEVYDKVANRNLWLLRLNDSTTEFSTKKIIPNKFIFGGKRFGNDLEHKAEIKAPVKTFDPKSLNEAHELHFDRDFTNVISKIEPSTITEIESINKNIKNSSLEIIDVNINQESLNTNFNNVKTSMAATISNQENDFTKGKSLFVGAVLTSATIPIAFPPRQWTFESADGIRYKHWMVDGGIVNNRPIDAAVKAGAEFIVSFELTPLLSATTEMKKEYDEYPSFLEVISKSMVDSTLNAGFYKYFEDLVTENIDFANSNNGNKKYSIYRMAPMMYNNPEDLEHVNGVDLDDNTIGTYDFNGKYDKKRNFRMGIFDWFMKGYIDTVGFDNITPNDVVYNKYINLPDDYGAKKNANQGRNSGFYDASLQAHPG